MKKWLAFGIPILLLVGLVAWRFTTRSAAQGMAGGGGKFGGGKRGANTAPVQVVVARARDMVATVQSVGNVESPYKIEISPKSAGRILYLQVREGDPVTPGEVLLKIDPSDLQGAVVQQQASVAEARSRLAQAQITTTATDVGITSQIQQQAAGVASAQADLNQTQRNYDAQVAQAQAMVDTAAQGVQSALAGVAKEKATLANLQAKYNREENLFSKGYAAQQDVQDAQTAVAAQEQTVAVAQNGITSAQSQLNIQQQNLTITKRKGQADIAASRAKLTQAQAMLTSARANRAQSPAYRENLAALKSQVNAAIAQLQQAQAKLRDTVVTSTISGTVTARKANPGDLASPGSPVIEIQYLDWVYVTANLPIDVSTQIKAGDVAQITIDAIPGRTFSGPITNVNPAADPASRQFSVRIRLDNPSHTIRPGMYARVSVVSKQVNNALFVPREAVTTLPDGTTTVTVVDAAGLAHIKPVSLGMSDSQGYQVLSGLSPGEQVVILSYSPLKEGQKVMLGRPGGAGGRRGQGAGRRANRGQ